MADRKNYAPKAAATAKGADVAGAATNATMESYHSAEDDSNSSAFLFEQLFRGDLWRLQVCRHKGVLKCNFRKWYYKDHEWHPGADGVTFSPDRLADLMSSLVNYHNGLLLGERLTES